MKAVNYYLLVEKIKEKPSKIGGIELTEDQNNDIRYVKAKVISAGNLVQGVKNDDIISYDKHAGFGIEFEDKLYYVIRSGDIVLID